MCEHFPFQGPPKFNQIGIFGVKINHLATLALALKIENDVVLTFQIRLVKSNYMENQNAENLRDYYIMKWLEKARHP
jgi:hypothetical protein